MSSTNNSALLFTNTHKTLSDEICWEQLLFLIVVKKKPFFKKTYYFLENFTHNKPIFRIIPTNFIWIL